jgi:CRP-like cAMP-binding protein
MDYRIEVLRDVPGLTELSPVALARLAEEFEVASYEDQVLCAEGKPADTLYVLAEGNAEVIKSSHDGRKFRVAVLTAGCLFGHLGALSLARRTATVRCLGLVKVLQMSAAHARELLRRGDFAVTSPFRRALIVALGRQLNTASTTTMKLAVDLGLAFSGQETPKQTMEGVLGLEQEEELRGRLLRGSGDI